MITYYMFLLLNVFLIVSIAGSIFGVLAEIIDNPNSIANELATSIPKQSTFYINYVVIQAFSKCQQDWKNH